jgi:hypothetical protein
MKLNSTITALLLLVAAETALAEATRPAYQWQPSLPPFTNPLRPHDPLMNPPANGASLPAPAYAPDRPSGMPSDLQPRPLPGTQAPLIPDPSTGLTPRP